MKTTLLLIVCLVTLQIEGATPVDPFSPEGQIIKRLGEKTRMTGWEEYSLSELIRYEMLTDMTIEIQRRYHVRISDYLQYTAEQLEDINQRLFLVKQIRDAFGIHYSWTVATHAEFTAEWAELCRVRPDQLLAYRQRGSRPMPYSGEGGVKPVDYQGISDSISNMYHRIKVESQLDRINRNLGGY